jgi:hypothetical protein
MQEETPVGDNGDYYPSGKGWRKSSYSMSNSHCIEVSCPDISSPADRRCIAVRDSKATAGTGPVLRFDSRAWTAFLAGLRIQPHFKSLSTHAESSYASRGQELSALLYNEMQVAWNISLHT